MGINYRLQDRERKAEEKKEKEQPKDERTAMLAPASPTSDEEGAEKTTPAPVTLDDVARMDEDTV